MELSLSSVDKFTWQNSASTPKSEKIPSLSHDTPKNEPHFCYHGWISPICQICGHFDCCSLEIQKVTLFETTVKNIFTLCRLPAWSKIWAFLRQIGAFNGVLVKIDPIKMDSLKKHMGFLD